MATQERTEKPTPRRVTEAKQRGAAARSRLLGRSGVLIGGAAWLIFHGDAELDLLVQGMRRAILLALDPGAAHGRAMAEARTLFLDTVAGPLVLACLALLGVLFVQTGPRFALGASRPPDPAPGPGGRIGLALVRVTAVIAGLIVSAPTVLAALLRTSMMTTAEVLLACGRGVLIVALWCAFFEAVAGVLESVYLKWLLWRSLHMTRREAMDEARRESGDPRTRRARLGRQRGLAYDGNGS